MGTTVHGNTRTASTHSLSNNWLFFKDLMSEIWVFLNIPIHSLYSFTKKIIWKILFENVNIFTNSTISVEAAKEGAIAL